jgi:HUS1 checkpoint protein
LFHPDTYSISSKHHNLIAFQVELGLLMRVLRGAGANEVEVLDVKLTQKASPGAAAGAFPSETQPYLTFTARVSDRLL